MPLNINITQIRIDSIRKLPNSEEHKKNKEKTEIVQGIILGFLFIIKEIKLLKALMSHSPKVVAIDLGKYSHKKNLSPFKNTKPRYQTLKD